MVKKGQTVFARYLGEVYDAKKPFDENFSGTDPAGSCSSPAGGE